MSHAASTGERQASAASAMRSRPAATAPELAQLSRLSADAVMEALATSADGLTAPEAQRRLSAYGPNLVARERPQSVAREIIGRAVNPLNALLLVLALISYVLADQRAAVLIASMIILSVSLGFVQEHRSNRAAARLRAMVRTTATVRRPAEGQDASAKCVEVAIEQLVPGDVVHLCAGDMVPADVRLLSGKDLFLNQAALTGEAMPVEKLAGACEPAEDAFSLKNACFMGSDVVSGTAQAVVVQTGARACFGQVADTLVGPRALTSFDRGVDRFTWLMLGFIAVMVPTVFLINGFLKGDWLEALLFAVAVGVGLTPEMLPMIVTVNLAKGAIAMSRKRVIVKRLNAIQNFGAMDVLCTDKTGTLTQDRIILSQHYDIRGEESRAVLEYAYLNSYYQSGLNNLLDVAVLQHVELEEHLQLDQRFEKVDELPFDFQRRRMSVVLQTEHGEHLLICKGAVEEVLGACSQYRLGTETGTLDAEHIAQAQRETAQLNADGFRVVAVAFRTPARKASYTVADECQLCLLGYIAFLDPPKDSAREAVAALQRLGVAIKILTGDNEVVAAKVCRDVGLGVARAATGYEVDTLTEPGLADLAQQCSLFAKTSPAQKARVIRALQRRGHVVGFLGDGINDGPALKAADVGISVDTAVDIAKESADIILLEKSLLVLSQGVIEGRKIFGNITKYIKMGASSNFGNMFSMIGASLFLPFLPMAPLQILTNNLLYDLSQTTIPADNVDEEYLLRPRKWDIDNIRKFMLLLGPVSSLFDYATFCVLLLGFDAWRNPKVFQSGWFVESLLTQTLIIHVIRTARIPFLQSRASRPLMASTVLVAAIGVWLPNSPLADALGLTTLPVGYWGALALILIAYLGLTQGAKTWFVRRWGL